MSTFSLRELTPSQRLTVLGWYGLAFLLITVSIFIASDLAGEGYDASLVLILVVVATFLTVCETAKRGYYLVASPTARFSYGPGLWWIVVGGVLTSVVFMLLFPDIGDSDNASNVMALALAAEVALYSTTAGVLYGGHRARQNV